MSLGDPEKRAPLLNKGLPSGMSTTGVSTEDRVSCLRILLVSDKYQPLSSSPSITAGSAMIFSISKSLVFGFSTSS